MTKPVSTKLLIGLIHNNNQQRYKYIRPALDQLKIELSAKFNIEIFEVYKQPGEIHYKTWLTMLRKYLLWQLNREWIKYRKLKPRNMIVDIGILIRRLILTYISSERENRRSAIDTFITDKHIRVWNYFFESKADFLICFEDDAIFKTTSIKTLKKILSGIKKHRDKLLYLDFAGGCDQETLKVNKLELDNDRLRRYYIKPVTNTGCCYMINRPTAEVFFDNLLKYFWLRLIPFDWLLNKIFILTASKYNYICYHANPPIFDHGSATGSKSSWLEEVNQS